jgi:hypothetical protein
MKVLYVCVSCTVYIVVRLMLFHYGCLSKRTSVKKSLVCLCVLSCIYCCTSYVISLWVCVNESICIKVLYVCVSCPVYIVLRLMLFNYRRVSKRASVWKFVCVCVLSCIYCRMSYVIYLWACVSESIYMYQNFYVYIIGRLMLFHYVLSLLSLLCIFSVCWWELLVATGYL